jgi:hypothetical protein
VAGYHSEAGDVARKPDSTAVTTALWRAAHLRLDAPPHVLEDDVGLRLLRDSDVLAAYLGPEAAPGPDAWLFHPNMGERFRRWRAGIVARARLAEDIVAEQVDRGHDQYVILGATLPPRTSCPTGQRRLGRAAVRALTTGSHRAAWRSGSSTASRWQRSGSCPTADTRRCSSTRRRSRARSRSSSTPSRRRRRPSIEPRRAARAPARLACRPAPPPARGRLARSPRRPDAGPPRPDCGVSGPSRPRTVSLGAPYRWRVDAT